MIVLGRGKGAWGLCPLRRWKGVEPRLGGMGKKLEYNCILCNGKSVFTNTKM